MRSHKTNNQLIITNRNSLKIKILQKGNATRNNIMQAMSYFYIVF